MAPAPAGDGPATASGLWEGWGAGRCWAGGNGGLEWWLEASWELRQGWNGPWVGGEGTEGRTEPAAGAQPTQPACLHGSHSFHTHCLVTVATGLTSAGPAPPARWSQWGRCFPQGAGREDVGYRGGASQEHQGRLPSGSGLQAEN